MVKERRSRSVFEDILDASMLLVLGHRCRGLYMGATASISLKLICIPVLSPTSSLEYPIFAARQSRLTVISEIASSSY